jgi:NAD-dependent SIR2 family protein deacetylase
MRCAGALISVVGFKSMSLSIKVNALVSSNSNCRISFDFLEAFVPSCDSCRSLVRPNIVFLNESFPAKLCQCAKGDFDVCDLVLVVGSSLDVQPFGALLARVGNKCPIVYINPALPSDGFFRPEQDKRTTCLIGSCDAACMQFVDQLKWSTSLEQFVKFRNILRDS